MDERVWRLVEKRTYRADASADIALTLRLVEREPVVVTDSVLADAAEHRQFHRLYVPVKLLQRFGWDDAQASEASGLYGLLDSVGERLHWIENVRARMPSPEDARLLRIASGTPEMRMRRITSNAHQIALLLEETRVSAEDSQLVYRLGLAE